MLYIFSSLSTVSMAEDTDFSASAVALSIKFLFACFVIGTLDLNEKREDTHSYNQTIF